MSNSRRSFLKAAGLAVVTTQVDGAPAPHAAAPDAAGQSAADQQALYSFFNADEARFIEAAVARLIPADEAGPGALEADVPRYLDKQLAGAWGAGERLYRSGPWREGTPQQGYQLPFTPAELFRNALRGVQQHVQQEHQAPFHELSAEDQDAYLESLHSGRVDLGGVPSNVFFESLWEMTVEGFFSDPVYGGNKDMISWKMIGFPGAYASFYDLVDQHGVAFERAPVSMADHARRRTISIHPEAHGAPHAPGQHAGEA